MSTEDNRQENGQGNGQQPDQEGTGADENATPAERFVDVAREQATQAAGALRRGEFMQEPIIDQEASSDDRLIAMLSYASQIVIPFIMPAIVLISDSSKRHPFQRYHAVQSMALMIVFMGLGATLLIGTTFLSVIPFIGWIASLMWLALCCLFPIAFIMVVMAFGFYGYQAYQGKRFAIPGLTSFLYDQGWLS